MKDPFDNEVIRALRALNALAGKLYDPSPAERRRTLIEIGEKASELEKAVQNHLAPWNS